MPAINQFPQLKAADGAGNVNFTQAGVGAVTRTVQDRLRDSVSVKDFGAVGNGVVDDTAAIQAAIDYVEAINYASGAGGGRPSIYIPAGLYLVSGLVCDKMVEFYGAGMGATVLRLVNGSTNSLFTFNAEDVPGTSVDDTNHYRLENMTLSGNRTDSTTTGTSRGVNCPATAWPMSTQYSTAFVGNNLEIANFTGDGIYLGTNRNWLLLDNTIVRYCNDNALASFAYDHLISNSSFGVCKNFGVRFYAGGSNTLTNCTIFFNTINVVVNVDVNSPCFFNNCAMDAAAQHAVSINGPVGTEISHVFTGCRFTSSSRTVANTYSDLFVSGVTGGAQVIGCTFSLGSQAVKYLVEIVGSTEVYFTGNFFDTAGTPPYGTAITNDFTRLITAGYRDAYCGPYGGAGTFSVVVNGTERMRINSARNIQYQSTIVENATPGMLLNETDGAVDEKKWIFGANAGQLALQAINDAEGSFSDAFRVTRSGGTVTAVAVGGALGLPSYVKASLPSAATAGRMIFVTDDVGGSTPAFSDGTNWRRVADRNIIS